MEADTLYGTPRLRPQLLQSVSPSCCKRVVKVCVCATCVNDVCAHLVCVHDVCAHVARVNDVCAHLVKAHEAGMIISDIKGGADLCMHQI